MINENVNLSECNGIMVTLDSARYDTAVSAQMQNLSKIGELHRGYTLSTYTPAAHTSIFLGHLPSTRIDGKFPYYHEPAKQLWRITTGPARDANKGCGILFHGNNVIEGYRRMNTYVLGIGGVSQFSSKSFLREAYPWTNFIYYGPDMNEEPLAPRNPETFPLNHVEEIAETLRGKEQWFLFINCPEPHYPYDWGKGIDDKIMNIFPQLAKTLNLRSLTAPIEAFEALKPFADDLWQMQEKGLRAIDLKLEFLFRNLKQISERPIYAVVCGDHGENFGDGNSEAGGSPLGLYGHMHPSRECTQVPMWMGML